MRRRTRPGLAAPSKLCNNRGMAFKWHAYIIIFCCCVSLPSGAQEASDAAKIIVMEKKWGDAYKQRDLDLLSSLLAEDFVITVEDGSTYSKVGT